MHSLPLQHCPQLAWNVTVAKSMNPIELTCTIWLKYIHEHINKMAGTVWCALNRNSPYKAEVDSERPVYS